MRVEGTFAKTASSASPRGGLRLGVYVQYGCGLSCPEGWINFDASPILRLQRLPIIGALFLRGPTIFPRNVRYGDIVRGLPLGDGTVDGIYASHVLEHLSLIDFSAALRNTFRLLRPGGTFRLIVPDLEIRARSYIDRLEKGDASANSWFMRASNLGLERRAWGLEAAMRTMLGNSAHLWMWDEKSIFAALKGEGFVHVRRCQFNDSDDAAFSLVEDAGRFFDQRGQLNECAIEARRSHE